MMISATYCFSALYLFDNFRAEITSLINIFDWQLDLKNKTMIPNIRKYWKSDVTRSKQYTQTCKYTYLYFYL